MELLGSATRKPGFQPYSRDVGNQTLHKVEECFGIVSKDSSVFRPKWKNRWKSRPLDWTDLPPETVKKYCQTPPPIEELCSILGDDFTLYYGFEVTSSVVTSSSNVLQASFEATGRGGLMVEYIQVVRKKFTGPPHNFNNPDPYGSSTLVNRLVKIKWNKICIHEEEGTNNTDFKSIAESGLTALLDKLGQYFFTVKAKLAYFNNGLPPLCEDEEKNKAMRVVKRSDLPSSVSIKDVWDLIKQFFTIKNGICKKTHMELVFGPEFELPEMITPIIKMIQKNRGIKDKRLGWRYFKSEESSPIWNNFAVYIRITPSEVRKKLMKLPDCHDMWFYLIPPCGFIDKSHLSWIADWTAQRFAYEFKLFEMQVLDEGPKKNFPLVINEEEIRNAPQFIDYSQNTNQVAANELNMQKQDEDLMQISPQVINEEEIRNPLQFIDNSQNINQVGANEPLKMQKQDEEIIEKSPQVIDVEEIQNPPQFIDHSQNINQVTANETLKMQTQGEDLMKKFLHINEEPTGKPPQSIDYSQNINQDAANELLKMQKQDEDLMEKSPQVINVEEIRNPPQFIDHIQNINQVTANETLKMQKQGEDQMKKFLHINEEPTGKPPQSIDHSQNINQDAANELLKMQKQGQDLMKKSPHVINEKPKRKPTRKSPRFIDHSQNINQDAANEPLKMQKQDEDLMKKSIHINEEPTRKSPQSIDHSQNINQVAVGQKRDWQHVEPHAGNIHSGPFRSESVPSKQPRAQPPPQREDQQWEDLKPEDWGNIGPLVVVWPVDIHSEYEKNPRNVLEANFPTDIALESNNKVSVYVTLPLRNGRSKKFRLYVGEGEDNATKIVLDLIVMHSDVIKYANSFLPEGGLVPNFIRNNVPCRTNPRTYLLLSLKDTGPLDEAQIIYLFNCFKDSLNEDLFFDKNDYSLEMKLLLLDLAPKHGLKVRHFGDEQKLVDRYICVYKEKPKDVILNVLKVLKMGDFHPKYRLVSNKVSAQMDLNLN